MIFFGIFFSLKLCFFFCDPIRDPIRDPVSDPVRVPIRDPWSWFCRRRALKHLFFVIDYKVLTMLSEKKQSSLGY